MRRFVPIVAGLVVASTALSAPSLATATTDVPPTAPLAAFSVLPPGESGTFSAAAQAQYEADGNPADFGPHVDDQREMYWTFQRKDAGFAHPSGTPVEPRAGVRIYRDDFGVPVIYGDNGYDVWFGAGYAAATDRLFEIDAVRRTARGTLAELAGPSDVPSDLEERTLTYTNKEYDAMLARLSPRGQAAITGYAAGVEARIKETQADPTLLPAEYQLLSTTPADWTVEDTLAAGVYITRDVAAQGGLEMDNVASLRQLVNKYGRSRGRRAFQELFPDDNPKAVTTVTGRHFSNLPVGDRSAKARARDFQRAAAYAEKLPLDLAYGAGTGAAAAPAASLARPFSLGLHGGSFAYAVTGKHTVTGNAMLSSNPQLDYSYPSLLYELEVHGGGYDARGVGVPGIPTVGIGHTAHIAWGLTTGYSKTIDSFIETTRPNPKSGGPPQYLHDGTWHDESCRIETIHYRQAPNGVPAGPPSFSKDYRICRTIHGPIVAVSKDGRLARSVDYAMWKHEVDTVEGILDWDRASSLAQLRAGVERVTWNENIVAADDHGNIGYWHPGRYFRRTPGVDQRFPLDGRGAQDERGYLSFPQMPHVVNPPAGYVANWNTKPAHGWVDGDLSGSNTRPGGRANRVVVIRHLLAAHGLGSATLLTIDRLIGEADMRAPAYLPAIRRLRLLPGLTATERQALRLLNRWDGRAYAPGSYRGSSPLGTPAADVTDGPAATLFAALRTTIHRILFGGLPAPIRVRLDTLGPESHRYDVTPMDNLVLRVLRPRWAGLPPPTVVIGHRDPRRVLRHALDAAITVLTKRYGAHISTWRRHHAVSHLDSLTGVVGPSTTMPFEDRGSWVQEVAFTRRIG